MGIISNIFKFITDPKNTRMILLGLIVVIAFLFFRQCSKTEKLQNQIKEQKIEAKRTQNNYDASLDTIRQYKRKDSTLVAEKQVYKLKAEELEGAYSELLEGYEKQGKEKVRTVTKTEIEIRDRIDSVDHIIFITDSSLLAEFVDSSDYGKGNYRILSGDVEIAYKLDTVADSLIIQKTKISAQTEQGIALKTFLLEDPVTGKIKTQVQTNYPGVSFTNIEGASVMDDPMSRNAVKKMRKNNSIGVGAGYGVLMDVKNGNLSTGPYIGVQFNWSPKWAQW